MRSLILVASLIALLMYVGFAAQQGGATLAGAPLQAPVEAVSVPTTEPVGGPGAPRRFAPLSFLTEGPTSCVVQ